MEDENWDAIIAELEVNNEEYDNLITDVVTDVSILFILHIQSYPVISTSQGTGRLCRDNETSR